MIQGNDPRLWSKVMIQGYDPRLWFKVMIQGYDPRLWSKLVGYGLNLLWIEDRSLSMQNKVAFLYFCAQESLKLLGEAP